MATASEIAYEMNIVPLVTTNVVLQLYTVNILKKSFVRNSALCIRIERVDIYKRLENAYLNFFLLILLFWDDFQTKLLY